MIINNQRRVINKRGITPIIATLLLIAIVVVVIAIIFMWSKSFIKESVQKKGLPADQACSEVKLQKSCSDGVLSMSNLGNIPIYQFDVKKNLGSRTVLQHSDDFVGIGESVEVFLGTDCPTDYKIVPYILGNSGSSNKIYNCVNQEF